GIDAAADLPPVAACPPDERRLLHQQLRRGLNCVPTSSMGRLFDAVSSLAGVCHHAGYEAQAALALETAALTAADEDPDPGYPFALDAADPAAPAVADPAP